MNMFSDTLSAVELYLSAKDDTNPEIGEVGRITDKNVGKFNMLPMVYGATEFSGDRHVNIVDLTDINKGVLMYSLKYKAYVYVPTKISMIYVKKSFLSTIFGFIPGYEINTSSKSRFYVSYNLRHRFSIKMVKLLGNLYSVLKLAILTSGIIAFLLISYTN